MHQMTTCVNVANVGLGSNPNHSNFPHSNMMPLHELINILQILIMFPDLQSAYETLHWKYTMS